jgi:hypothetical protein
MNATLLQKVEELALYTIEKQIELLMQELKDLSTKINENEK